MGGRKERCSRTWRAGAALLAFVLLLLGAESTKAMATGTEAWLDAAALRRPPVLAWFGPQAAGSLAAVRDGRLPLQRLSLEQPVPFGPGKALWLKLRLRTAATTAAHWQLEVPLSVVDHVTVHQQDASGRWVTHSAGDAIAMREWPQPGRYPVFALQLQPGVPGDVYVEVRHATPLSLPLRVTTTQEHHRHALLEYMALGLSLGALGLLLAASLLRAWRLRDALYGWYALHALVTMLALAAFTGVAAHLLWGDAVGWTDAAPGSLALLAAALTARIVARLGAVRTRIRWIAGWLYLFAWTGLAFSIAFVFVPREIGVVLLAVQLPAVCMLCLCAAILTWRRGDPVGLWLLLAVVPSSVAVLAGLARAGGWLTSSWLTEYGVVLALALGVPLLFAALDSRSQERRSVELRRQAAASLDALTGLMKREPFIARLRQAIARFQRRGEGAAVAVIELTNHGWIQKTRGAEAAEEALLRAVIKLRRLVRDVDTTARLGENRFGLILEGVAMRKPMTSVASRLVAAGLMEEPGRPGDVVLHFHIAALVLNEHDAPAEELLAALDGTLARMSPRTQRAFRFVEPAGTAEDGSAPGVAEPAAAGGMAAA